MRGLFVTTPPCGRNRWAEQAARHELPIHKNIRPPSWPIGGVSPAQKQTRTAVLCTATRWLFGLCSRPTSWTNAIGWSISARSNPLKGWLEDTFDHRSSWPGMIRRLPGFVRATAWGCWTWWELPAAGCEKFAEYVSVPPRLARGQRLHAQVPPGVCRGDGARRQRCHFHGVEMNSLPINGCFRPSKAEASFTGTPAVFVRLQGCPVGCPWCDTKHTWLTFEGASARPWPRCWPNGTIHRRMAGHPRQNCSSCWMALRPGTS